MKPVIIEFNGPQGLGKRAVAKKLENTLSAAGYQIKNTDDLINQYKGKRFNKIIELTKANGLWLNLYLFIFLFSLIPFRPSRLGSLSAFWTYLYIYYHEKESDILIVDQGMIQSLAACVHVNKLKHKKSFKKIIEQINLLEANLICVNAVGKNDLSAEHIDVRNKFKQVKKLTRHKQTFDQIREELNEELESEIIYLDMTNQVDANCDIIKYILKKYQC